MAAEQRPVVGPAPVADTVFELTSVGAGDGVGTGRRRRRRGGPERWVLAIVVAVVVTAIATYLLATQVESSGTGSASGSPYFTGRAAERVVTDSVTADGQVVHAQETSVVPSAADGGTLIVTDLRAHLGDQLDEGAVPVVVSGRPVIVLQGSAPAYRDLAPGDSGADVAQLQDALRRQGFTVTDAPGVGGATYGPSTAAAVGALYGRLGFSPTATSPDATGQVRQAGLAVADAQAALRSAQRALDQATPETEADLADARDAAARSLTAARDAYGDVIARTGAKVPRSEVVFVPAVPAAVTQVPGRVGQALMAGDPAVTLASGAVVVRAAVPSARTGEIRQGMRATIGVGGAEPVTGIVSVVDGAAANDPAAGNGPGAAGGGVTVEITPDQPLTVTAGAAVPITIELAASDGPTLAVPVAAIDERPDGTQGVRVLEGDTARRVRVRAGVSGDGWVAVRPVGEGLSAGDRVILGRRRSR